MGKAPFDENVQLPICSQCTLNMRDTAEDGWSGNYFVGFGIRQTMSGASQSFDFSTECGGSNENSSNATNSTDSDEVTSNVVVGGGGSKSEVRWKLVCDGAEIIGQSDGRAPFEQSVSLPTCTTC